LSSNLGQETRLAFAEAKQGQVFRFWDKLNQVEREALVSQANQIDLIELREGLHQALNSDLSEAQSFANIEPTPWISLPADLESDHCWRDAHEQGEELLRKGRVAAFTVAGGQGTRLGYNGPKGAYPVTPVTKKPLFQVFAEKLKAAEKRYGKNILWFVMTSEANHSQTKEFFNQSNYFGISSSSIRFIQQGMMPAVLETGEIILESPSRIAMNPDGHGGSFRALANSGATEEMIKKGIEIISYFQVDNPLAPFLEPSFLGFHASTGSQMSSRAAPKTGPEEKVGVFCLRNGSLTVIEYSDLPEKLACHRQSDGSLTFKAGNLAMHAIDPSFAHKLGKRTHDCKLPFHAARKKIPTIDEKGNPVSPKKPNGIKLETFVFDALPFAKNPCVMEVSRQDAFSPVKNADGTDSIQTCQADQLRKFARWARAAGAEIDTDASGLPSINFEISAGFALDHEEFALRWEEVGKPSIIEGTVFT